MAQRLHETIYVPLFCMYFGDFTAFPPLELHIFYVSCIIF